MSTIQPRPSNDQALHEQLLECLAALNSDIELLRQYPNMDATITELSDIAREIETHYSSSINYLDRR
jgi:hypothetical protein